MNRTQKPASQMTAPCYCGSNQPYEQCCGPVIATKGAATAEQLMRSRYTAFVLLDTDYLLATWHPDFRPRNLELDPEQRWLGLRIKRTEAGQPHDSEGIVEFVARYKIAGKGHRLHEVSRFCRSGNHWYYLDGAFPEK